MKTPLRFPTWGRRWRHSRLAFVVVGAAALLWVLLRVVPKPRRIAYPCQRAAAPVAGTFIIWLLGVFGARAAWHRARYHLGRLRHVRAVCFLAAALAAGVVAVTQTPVFLAWAEGSTPHGALGQGKGIHPGRVVWVHAPEATDWEGYTSTNRWWSSNCTDKAVVSNMVSVSIRRLAGAATDADAWDALFRYFNESHGRGYAGYRQGEKIAIKLNMVPAVYADPVTYSLPAVASNLVVNSPQVVLALLHQLVSVVGVAATNITVGDTTCILPNHIWEILHAEFPEVHYLDNRGLFGRERAAFSTVPVYWSVTNANGKTQDYLPVSFAEADYFINAAVLKGHSSGITGCGKNNYGSLIRTPDGMLRGAAGGYYDLHLSLPNPDWSPGMGHYRAIVDLMAHPQLGGKTLLCMIDGLFGGYYWEAKPVKWTSYGFGNDWPSSLFVSQDPVAIDSVAYDFLNAEWPKVVSSGDASNPAGQLQGGAEDYLHEAALAGSPPSGTAYDPDRDGVRAASLGVHEHWNDSTNRQYGRNLGLSMGIEIVAVTANSPTPPEANPQVRIAEAGVADTNLAIRVRDLMPQVTYAVEQCPELSGSLWTTAAVYTATSHEAVWLAPASNLWPAMYFRVRAQ